MSQPGLMPLWVRQCSWLTALAAAMWSALAVVAYTLGGSAGLEGLTYAALLCLLPGWLVFFVGSRYREPKPQAVAMLMGTVVRILVVLAGVLTLQTWRPGLGFWEFLVWVVVFYLAMLAAETWLLVRVDRRE